MARKKKATQKIKDNLASLVASQTTASIDQGSTLVNGDQESQPESQPAPVISTQSKTPSYTWTQPAQATPRPALAIPLNFRRLLPRKVPYTVLDPLNFKDN